MPPPCRAIALLRQVPSRIVDYSGTKSSLYLRQPRQSFNLGKRQIALTAGFVGYEYEEVPDHHFIVDYVLLGLVFNIHRIG